MNDRSVQNCNHRERVCFSLSPFTESSSFRRSFKNLSENSLNLLLSVLTTSQRPSMSATPKLLVIEFWSSLCHTTLHSRERVHLSLPSIACHREGKTGLLDNRTVIVKKHPSFTDHALNPLRFSPNNFHKRSVRYL